MPPKLTTLSHPSVREVTSEPRSESPALALTNRPRRNRKAEWSRRLVRENSLSADDLIWPLFLMEGAGRREPVASMPQVERLTVDEAVREAERAAARARDGDGSSSKVAHDGASSTGRAPSRAVSPLMASSVTTCCARIVICSTRLTAVMGRPATVRGRSLASSTAAAAR